MASNLASLCFPILFADSLIPYIGWGLWVLLWWPFRKTDALRSLPWFFGAHALSHLLSYLAAPAISQIKEAINSAMFQQETAVMALMSGTAIVAIWKSLCYLLMAANAAFLLDRVGYTSHVVGILKRLYTRHLPLGLTVMVLDLISGISPWILAELVIKK